MPVSIVVILAFALMAVAVSSAVSIFFVCKLVERVSKLNAARTVEEYAQLRSIDKPPAPPAPPEPTNYASEDGTLTEEAISNAASKIK